MTDKLPPQLLALFAPRPPLRYLLPADVAPEKRKTPAVSGIAQFLAAIPEHDQDYVPTDTAEQQKDKRRAAKQARIQKQLRDGVENCMTHLASNNLYFGNTDF
jgi:U1 small nuclear ribonucleoprotein 70kDa